MRRAARALALVPLAAASLGAAAPEAGFLRFANAPADGAPLLDPPRLAVSFGGEERRMVVDTGSTGVVVSAGAIPAIDRLRSLGPGQLTYSSSGRIMVGRWVVTPMTIGGVAVDSLPVLAIDAIRCTPAARHCTPADHPAGVAMLGIGFGREHDAQAQSTPDRNPLLHLRALPAGRARGYVLTAQGIVVGVPRDRAGFVTVRLVRDAAHGDWQAPAACITVAATAPACGTVLVDTGIPGMFLTVPGDRLGGGRDPGDATRLAAGTRVAIDLAPGGGVAAGYASATGDPRDPVAPATVTLAGVDRRPPFVNTGVRFLNRFDYLYDAEAGLVGYRQRR